ncbi:hypothetical protein H5410_029530 [Solanum commersonii]|uniref:NB-ARC domain-containing protein n=1 Tax=Solanum commersonii TaxID=4109 RepID=A0A9J5YEW7_SOLCO|nr:hypothetical protein H5410_029530 [Solanum commersonii]
MHICYTNLKASTSAEIGRFIKQLLETSPDILREYLIHLQEHMLLETSPDILREYLIHLQEHMVSTLVHDLEEKLRNKESTDETNRATLKLLENIELLKEDLKHVYMKVPDSSHCCFPMSDGPLFMHLLQKHLNDLLDSNAYSIALIREEIELVKQDLEFIRSFLVNVEQEMYKVFWARGLDVAYELKDVIYSIIVRENGLLHLIFSLPITIKKMKLIKEEVSDLHEKIPKNMSLIVVNTPKKPVESKSLTTGKIIVGFEEETNWLLRKLTSGPADLDVISITGMPGSGKTTLAYKVYNDKSVSSHFDLRAWCTVDQGHDEKKLNKIFNQVSDSVSKLSENIDVADKLRKQLYGKRYLIVLDDVWDTTTWDELTRPFPEVVKGSRIILTTREKEVALHGKLYTAPLNLRLLRSEESWELLEKRAFGNESCPDELLDVGKEIAENCKGLPLVADLIAGVIAGREKKKTVWLEVRNNLNSFIFNGEVEVMKIFPIELEVMHICFTNLETSTSAEVERFIKKLLETSPDILREYLIHLQEHMVSTLVWDLKDKSRNEESVNETNRATLDLLENIEPVKEDLKHVYIKAPDSFQRCFPMSDGPLFMHLLHRHLNDLLNSNAYSIALIKEEIGLVKQDLEFIRSFFVNDEQELYKDLWAHVLDVAYEAKDVIDSIIVRDNGLLHLIFSLPITIKKIKLIKEDISNLLEKIPKNRSLIVVNSPKKSVESKSLTTGKIIVGFEEETNWIIRKLTSGLADLDVISITGMPGSGKTTLAYKVYNDKSVSSHFDLRAWCTVGQEYDEKKLLHKIFNQVSDSVSKLSENIDVADMLRKQLFGKRYLIVIDDVWDTTKWDDLTRPFPTVDKGSRIILTTRELEVALHGKRNTDPLNLRLLRPEESWELFDKRAFGKESCPDELLNVGKEIAENCKGLPLVADLIAGVVARKEKKKTVWLEVRNNLSSFILNSEVEVMKVIELSYDHLPNHLKPCFLYLARFPKDRPMIILALKDFWRAEGLVEQTEMKSVEEVMDVYLDNLISSSLVFLFNEIGDHPTCRLHDLVHDFCLMKAKKEKLFDRISSSAPPSSSDLMLRIVTIDCNSEFFLLNNFVLFGSNKIRHSSKHLYSLRIVGDKLDDHEPILIAEDTKLENLRQLENLELSYSKDAEDIFKKFPYLQGLAFRLKESWDYSTEGYWFPKLDFLTELEDLRIVFESSNTNDSGPSVATNRPWDFHFPASLKSLWLGVFPLSSDSLSIIARLPNLENLTLKNTIIQGEEWNMGEEDTFENLKFLELDEVALAKWEVGEESFPVLEKLVLWRCRKLDEIPPSFGDIYSLKIIKVDYNRHLKDSAMMIKQYVEDMTGEDKLQRACYKECRIEFPLPVHQLSRLKIHLQTSIAFSQLFYSVVQPSP